MNFINDILIKTVIKERPELSELIKNDVQLDGIRVKTKIRFSEHVCMTKIIKCFSY